MGPASLAVAVALAVLTLPSVAPAQPTPSAAAALDRALADLVSLAEGPAGAIAIVQRGDRLTVHTAGVADVATGRAIEPTDHMRMASVAKAYNGAVALALVDGGLLSLDDTIGELVEGPPETWSPIELRQLLNHTSGLPDYISTPDFQQALDKNPLRTWSPDELLPFAYGEPLRFAPGARYAYSNSDNVAVGLMIEAATERSYEEELAERVSGPLHLEETSLPSSAALPEPFLHGYFVEGGRLEDASEVLSPSGAWASGGVVSTPLEVNRFFRGNLGGELFGRRTQTEQLRWIPGGASDPPGPGRNSAGLGIFRYETRCGTVYGHTGNFPGYTQFAATSRDGTRSATVSISRQTSPQIAPEVFEHAARAYQLAVCAAFDGPTRSRLPSLLRRRG